MAYDIKWVRGHWEVYDQFGKFLLSADTQREAEHELVDMGF